MKSNLDSINLNNFSQIPYRIYMFVINDWVVEYMLSKWKINNNPFLIRIQTFHVRFEFKNSGNQNYTLKERFLRAISEGSFDFSAVFYLILLL